LPRRVAADLLVDGIGAADHVDGDFAEERFHPQTQPAPNVVFSMP
jgi:hypothetical protein